MLRYVIIIKKRAASSALSASKKLLPSEKENSTIELAICNYKPILVYEKITKSFFFLTHLSAKDGETGTTDGLF